MYEVFKKNFTYVDDLYFNIQKQIDFGEEIELDDSEALDYLQDLHSMNGILYVITDYCYEKKCGPFIIDSKEINKFVKNFFLSYGEAFYSTDIIVINFTKKLIWVLFHEGVCWLSKG